jgi:glycine cleavage system aminomethyltransferase T
VKLGKPGGFVGEEALRLVKADGPRRRLACLVLGDRRDVVLGGEPVLGQGGQVVGRVTSGGLGYTVGASIAYAYLPPDVAAPGARLEIDLFGVARPAVVMKQPLFDPAGERVRGAGVPLVSRA